MSRVDRRAALVGLACALALGAAPWTAAAQPAELPARVVTIAGRAEVSHAGAPAWKPTALRDEIFPGDAVRTITGRLTLLTGSGQAMRLGPRTQLALGGGDGATPGPVRVRLDGGRVWVSVLPAAAAPARVEVHAGPVTVVALHGGAEVGLGPDGSVLVSVYHGMANVAGDGWFRPLTQDQQVVVLPPGAAPKEIGRVKRDKADAEWISWNERQDSAGGYGAPVQK